MLKVAKKRSVLLLAGLILAVVLLGITAKVSYYLGERHISELILHSDIPNGEQAPVPANYSETIEKLRAERDRLSNDYDSACYNYQTLYDAYDELYAKADASASYEKIVRPDSARGNQDSCYR
jgi:hypothetical protein